MKEQSITDLINDVTKRNEVAARKYLVTALRTLHRNPYLVILFVGSGDDSEVFSKLFLDTVGLGLKVMFHNDGCHMPAGHVHGLQIIESSEDGQVIVGTLTPSGAGSDFLVDKNGVIRTDLFFTFNKNDNWDTVNVQLLNSQ